MRRFLLALALVPMVIVESATVSAADNGAVAPTVSLALAGPEHPAGATLVTLSNTHHVPIMYTLRASTTDGAGTDVLEAVLRAAGDDTVLYRGSLSEITVDGGAPIAPGTSVTYVIATQLMSTPDGQSAPAAFAFVADGWVQ